MYVKPLNEQVLLCVTNQILTSFPGFVYSACEKCHVPKVASAARGALVCPLCSDRQPGQGLVETDKKKGVVKDKEKNKRIKGQSSHATWKSETEMQLRQHYD